jgi:hypothetical protein
MVPLQSLPRLSLEERAPQMTKRKKRSRKRLTKGDRLAREHARLCAELEARSNSPCWFDYFESFYLAKYSAITSGLRFKRRIKRGKFRAYYPKGSPLTEFLGNKKTPGEVDRIFADFGERQDISGEIKRHLENHIRYLARRKHRNQLRDARPKARKKKNV